jgi:hypothetical protein
VYVLVRIIPAPHTSSDDEGHTSVTVSKHVWIGLAEQRRQFFSKWSGGLSTHGRVTRTEQKFP